MKYKLINKMMMNIIKNNWKKLNNKKLVSIHLEIKLH